MNSQPWSLTDSKSSYYIGLIFFCKLRPWPKKEHVFGLSIGKINTCGDILVTRVVKEFWRFAARGNKSDRYLSTTDSFRLHSACSCTKSRSLCFG